MFSSSEYINKVCAMKKEGNAETIKYFVSFDPVTEEERSACQACGVTIYNFNEVVDCGAQN